MDAIGLPHPRAYGNFPRLIAEYVRKRQVLTLEDAVRKISSLPATRMRLFDRGALREGLWADITVFDLDRIQDNATYENPVAVPTGDRLRAGQRRDRGRRGQAHGREAGEECCAGRDTDRKSG